MRHLPRVLTYQNHMHLIDRAQGTRSRQKQREHFSQTAINSVTDLPFPAHRSWLTMQLLCRAQKRLDKSFKLQSAEETTMSRTVVVADG